LCQFIGQADLLLLDVPCSNTGVLARRVEAKYRFSKANQQKLIDVQRQIIADAIALVSDRGVVVYSTCSIDPAENEQQARWVTKWHPFRIEQRQSRLPAGGPGDSPTRYADGGYFAILKRKEK
jgi:16S rRNA (cytosine967-C5)-methyltransferase